MHQSLHALSLHRPYPWQPQVLWDTNRPRQSTGSITYLASVKQALLLEDEWMAKSLASALETSAAKELYLFLRMAFCICPVSASTDSPHCFWMTRLCPWHYNQSSTSWDPLRISQAYDSELVIWWKQRWDIWV